MESLTGPAGGHRLRARTRRRRPPKNWAKIDPDYETLRLDMQTQFNLGISRKPAAA